MNDLDQFYHVVLEDHGEGFIVTKDVTNTISEGSIISRDLLYSIRHSLGSAIRIKVKEGVDEVQDPL